MKKLRKLKFTLMEVTVAFGIFAILVAVLMQFLSTAQRSWNLAEKRARAYADSRILFDLIEKSLHTSRPATSITTGNPLSFDGVLPYRRSGSNLKNIGNISFSFNNNTGIISLSFNSSSSGDEILRNVSSFNTSVPSAFSSAGTRQSFITVNLQMFGSDEDYAV